MIKKTIRLVGIGIGIFVTFSIATNLVLPVFFEKFEFTNLVPFYTIVFLLMITISILRYEFLGIKVILTEPLVGMMGIILLLFALVGPSFSGNTLRFLSFFVLFLFSIFAYYLIKATHEEERRREEAEKLAVKERALRLQTEKLSWATTQFLLSTQHYFRTPLTSIIGYLEMMSQGTYGKEKIASALEVALELKMNIKRRKIW